MIQERDATALSQPRHGRVDRKRRSTKRQPPAKPRDKPAASKRPSSSRQVLSAEFSDSTSSTLCDPVDRCCHI
jgi:hypothetical protein